MNWYVFKHPRKEGDIPLLTLKFEPDDGYISSLAVRYGSIEVLSEEALNKKKE